MAGSTMSARMFSSGIYTRSSYWNRLKSMPSSSLNSPFFWAIRNRALNFQIHVGREPDIENRIQRYRVDRQAVWVGEVFFKGFQKPFDPVAGQPGPENRLFSSRSGR